ncbi:PPR superfamily protein [Tasmannia lanceolata]|uniref:PPR superfamily protein n=1 Tax=Tasmannia lanceolata TaxID=3420 RepID=UPI00406306FA
MHARNLLSCARGLTTNLKANARASASTFQRSGEIPIVDVPSYNRTINESVKSGFLDSAIQLFKEMPEHDTISWNLIIAGYARHGFPEQALDVFKEMVSQGIKENPSTFSSILDICSDFGFYREGLQVHCRVIFLGFCSNLFVGSALVDLYMQMGLVGLALRLFDELPKQNLATWNLILRGFCGLGRSVELIELFWRMQIEGVNANCVTFSYLIRGCSNGGFLDQGKQLHCHMIKLGWMQSNIFIANALVDLYSACGSSIDVRKLIEFIPAKDVISWNSIVSVHADNGLPFKALEFFYTMRLWGKRPSVRSFVGFLNLSSRTQNLLLGKQIHGFVLKLGFDSSSVHIQSALIDMYGKCNEIRSSVTLFNEIPLRNLECCNSLITSFLYCGLIKDVIEMFRLMVYEGVRPDHVTFSTLIKTLSLSASASLSSCQLLHCCVIKSGFESDIVVSCSLIDAYSRSGNIKFSHQIFDRISAPNTICYTSIISGYGRNGMGREGLIMLDEMIHKGLKPDAIMFLCVLMGCDHSGLVEEGKSVFESMKDSYGVNPDQRHYSCMVNLLGRAGLLEESEEMLKTAPLEGDSVMWSSLLRSCRVHGNEKVGKRAAKVLMELEPEDPAAYLQVLSFYSEIGDSERSEYVREIMAMKKIRREFGYSLIEVNDRYYLQE